MIDVEIELASGIFDRNGTVPVVGSLSLFSLVGIGDSLVVIELLVIADCLPVDNTN